MVDVQRIVIVCYLDAMARGDLETVCSCFTDDATIESPVYGNVLVRSFYERLFADTLSVEVDIKGIYRNEDMPSRWAAHFRYRWHRASGNIVETDLVDLFDFDDDRIAKLQIIFNAESKSRQQHAAGATENTGAASENDEQRAGETT